MDGFKEALQAAPPAAMLRLLETILIERPEIRWAYADRIPTHPTAAHGTATGEGERPGWCSCGRSVFISVWSYIVDVWCKHFPFILLNIPLLHFIVQYL